MLRCIRVNFKEIKWRGDNTAGVREVIIPSPREGCGGLCSSREGFIRAV
jgi:hypothetical protein